MQTQTTRTRDCVKITPIIEHDRKHGALVLCGERVTTAADLLGLDSENFDALTDYFGVGFNQLCDAFELPVH